MFSVNASPRSLQDRRSLGATLALIVGVGAASVLAALAAITNSPIVIGVFAGAILGFFLLFVPRFAMWACIVGALLISGFVTLFLPKLGKITWLFSMLGFFLTFASALTLATHSREARSTPRFIWIAGLLFVYALVITPLTGTTIGELFGGIKRYFQLWGLMFACAWLVQDRIDLSRIVKFLFFLGFMQMPLAAYQLIVLVPKRQGMGNGVVPIDVVCGTFEASLEGGGNSSGMVLFLTIVVAFVLAAWREGLIRPALTFLAVLLLIAPMGMGETKIVVVFLPLMLLVVFGRYMKQAPVASLFGLTLGLGATISLFWLYGTVFGKSGIGMDERLKETIAYNFGDVGYYAAYSLNRTTAISYWWRQHGWSNPHEMLFGHGLGSSYFSPASLVNGHVARAHGYIGIGLTAASTILWDLGLIGMGLMLALLASAWRTAGALIQRVREPWPRAALVAARVAFVLFGVMLFYTDSLLNTLSVQCLLVLSLGGVAAAYRFWGVEEPAPKHVSRAGPIRRPSAV
jgi:hypothetical protein